MNVKTIAKKSLGSNLFKIIETLLFNLMNLSKNIKSWAAKNDTFIEQVRYENTTDKSNESIHLELSTPTYDRGESPTLLQHLILTA